MVLQDRKSSVCRGLKSWVSIPSVYRLCGIRGSAAFVVTIINLVVVPNRGVLNRNISVEKCTYF